MKRTPRLLQDLASARVLRAQYAIVDAWHKKERGIADWEGACRALPLPKSPLASLAAAVARINAYQWHEEDKARDTKASDAVIARVKREIDRSNQRRVDAVEAFDSLLEGKLAAAGLTQDPARPLSSETPGSLVDRLSILVLKHRHMSEQRSRRDITPEQKAKFSSRVQTLAEQLSDLAGCLDALVADVAGRRRRFKTYFQLKMYNDPETNPFLRK